MGHFNGPIEARQVSGDRWELLSPLIWTEPAITIVVPTGFVTDFASIPRPWWFLWPKSGSHNAAATVHDYECQKRQRPSREVHSRLPRMMKVLHEPWYKRAGFYLAVSQFGPTWNTYRLPDGREVGPGGLNKSLVIEQEKEPLKDGQADKKD